MNTQGVRVPFSGIIPYTSSSGSLFYHLFPYHDDGINEGLWGPLDWRNVVYKAYHGDIDDETLPPYLMRLRRWKYDEWVRIRNSSSGIKSLLESEPIKWIYYDNQGSGNFYIRDVVKPLGLMYDGYTMNQSGGFSPPPSSMRNLRASLTIPENQAAFLLRQVSSGLDEMFDDPQANSIHHGYPALFHLRDTSNFDVAFGVSQVNHFSWIPVNSNFVPALGFHTLWYNTIPPIAGTGNSFVSISVNSGSGLPTPMFTKQLSLRLENIDDDVDDFYDFYNITHVDSGRPQESGRLGININAAHQIRHPLHFTDNCFVRQSAIWYPEYSSLASSRQATPTAFVPGEYLPHVACGGPSSSGWNETVRLSHFANNITEVIGGKVSFSFPNKNKRAYFKSGSSPNAILGGQFTSQLYNNTPRHDVNVTVSISGSTEDDFYLDNVAVSSIGRAILHPGRTAIPIGLFCDIYNLQMMTIDKDYYHYKVRPKVHVFLDNAVYVGSGLDYRGAFGQPSSVLTLTLDNPTQSFTIPSGFVTYAGDANGLNVGFGHDSHTVSLIGFYEVIRVSGDRKWVKTEPHIYCDSSGPANSGTFAPYWSLIEGSLTGIRGHFECELMIDGHHIPLTDAPNNMKYTYDWINTGGPNFADFIMPPVGTGIWDEVNFYKRKWRVDNATISGYLTSPYYIGPTGYTLNCSQTLTVPYFCSQRALGQLQIRGGSGNVFFNLGLTGGLGWQQSGVYTISGVVSDTLDFGDDCFCGDYLDYPSGVRNMTALMSGYHTNWENGFGCNPAVACSSVAGTPSHLDGATMSFNGHIIFNVHKCSTDGTGACTGVFTIPLSISNNIGGIAMGGFIPWSEPTIENLTQPYSICGSSGVN